MALALRASARHYPNQASNAQRAAGRHHCLQWHWHYQQVPDIIPIRRPTPPCIQASLLGHKYPIWIKPFGGVVYIGERARGVGYDWHDRVRHYPHHASNAQRPAGRHLCLQWHWHYQQVPDIIPIRRPTPNGPQADTTAYNGTGTTSKSPTLSQSGVQRPTARWPTPLLTMALAPPNMESLPTPTPHPRTHKIHHHRTVHPVYCCQH